MRDWPNPAVQLRFANDSMGKLRTYRDPFVIFRFGSSRDDDAALQQLVFIFETNDRSGQRVCKNSFIGPEA